jgi:hypothetical protein
MRMELGSHEFVRMYRWNALRLLLYLVGLRAVPLYN